LNVCGADRDTSNPDERMSVGSGDEIKKDRKPRSRKVRLEEAQRKSDNTTHHRCSMGFLLYRVTIEGFTSMGKKRSGGSRSSVNCFRIRRSTVM
jgi:hypothetical protein